MDERPASLATQLLNRIWAEYREMPGLSLTPAQAQRLWGLDAITSRDALALLVESKLLHCGEDGRYRRSTEGTAPPHAAYTAKARIEATRAQEKVTGSTTLSRAAGS
jgi:hypothetical protein